MELTLTTILSPLAARVPDLLHEGRVGGGFSIVGIPLLYDRMDRSRCAFSLHCYRDGFVRPAATGSLDVVEAGPLRCHRARDRHRDSDLLFRFLDHRATRSRWRDHPDLSRYGLCGAEVTTVSSTPKAITAVSPRMTTMVAHSGGPPLAMYLLPPRLSKDVSRDDQSVLHVGTRPRRRPGFYW